MLDFLLGNVVENNTVGCIEESLLVDGRLDVPQPDNPDHGLSEDNRRAKAHSDISPVLSVSENALPKVGAGAQKVRLNITTNAWFSFERLGGLEKAERVVYKCFVAMKQDWVDVAHAPKEVVVNVKIVSAALGINGSEVENGLFGSRGALATVR